MFCRFCGTELPAGSSPRREFCHNAHKQAHYRRSKHHVNSVELLREIERLTIRNRQLENELTQVKPQGRATVT
jgi:hypothetical protein